MRELCLHGSEGGAAVWAHRASGRIAWSGPCETIKVLDVVPGQHPVEEDAAHGSEAEDAAGKEPVLEGSLPTSTEATATRWLGPQFDCSRPSDALRYVPPCDTSSFTARTMKVRLVENGVDEVKLVRTTGAGVRRVMPLLVSS
jgi:hypothetical protein